MEESRKLMASQGGRGRVTYHFLPGSPACFGPQKQPVSQEGLVGDIKGDHEGTLRGEKRRNGERSSWKSRGREWAGTQQGSAEDLGDIALTFAPSRKMGWLMLQLVLLRLLLSVGSASHAKRSGRW